MREKREASSSRTFWAFGPFAMRVRDVPQEAASIMRPMMDLALTDAHFVLDFDVASQAVGVRCVHCLHKEMN